mmetsp:Transcript_26349/g.69246  ORF Transcript_26349/g.69246 Transcript_26349/m.69246 type:complete len:227 (+) Transcript_26349:566-1246(+)
MVGRRLPRQRQCGGGSAAVARAPRSELQRLDEGEPHPRHVPAIVRRSERQHCLWIAQGRLRRPEQRIPDVDCRRSHRSVLLARAAALRWVLDRGDRSAEPEEPRLLQEERCSRDPASQGIRWVLRPRRGPVARAVLVRRVCRHGVYSVRVARHCGGGRVVRSAGDAHPLRGLEGSRAGRCCHLGDRAEHPRRAVGRARRGGWRGHSRDCPPWRGHRRGRQAVSRGK